MISLFGAPGAGKTVQGQLLARKYGWEWVSYRDLLFGLHDPSIKFALEKGLFIDEEKVAPVIIDTLSRYNSYRRPVILDGFPSTYRELNWLNEHKKLSLLTGAIILRVPRGELWKRLVERKRVDDTRATIERRQDAYERNISCMIHFLKANGIEVREVDGGNSPEDVLARIETVLSDWELLPKKAYAKISPTPSSFSNTSLNRPNIITPTIQTITKSNLSTLLELLYDN